MTDLPTFVIALGAWLLPPTYDLLRGELTARGFPSEAPAHPSIGAEPPTKTLDDDVASLRALLNRLVTDEGKEVIVVAHSYGGVVGSCAVEGLARADREANGQKGGVVKMVYMSAFVLDQGGDYVYVDGAEQIAFHDVSPEVQEQQKDFLTHTSRAVYGGPVTYEPWHRIPSAYIICEEDQALPLPLQEMLASKLGKDWTYRLKSSHSPHLSMPGRVAKILKELAEKV
ncbi:hypothetical protein FE257_000446 [Aspergillus nanangensis]|uniref:AB hydrolase-1 domain-containing protein n=1 Tax=Aspergillus nanangensis TaxID=2582783 RepID=A0AAD4GXD1_ASPNN|nr:hypothetical protein FE257_000446 [Aspergillus nanangensis]